MDPISGGNPNNNPTNNPRMDLLHNAGNNDQLGGAAGSYGAAAVPQPPKPEGVDVGPMPKAPVPTPVGGAPKSAASYVDSARAGRPASAPFGAPMPASTPAAAPMPAPRPAPLYTSIPSGGGGDGGGIGIGALAGVVVVLLVLLGGMYFLFSSQVSSQNKRLQSAIDGLKNNSQTVGGDITSNTVSNADKITTKQLEVTDTDDGIDGLTVNGSSNLQGPVKVGQDLTVAGTVTASKFVGDGSGLSGLPAGTVGPPGATGLRGPAGAPNPNAINAQHASIADNCINCVVLQTDSPGSSQPGSLNINGTGLFGTQLGVGDESVGFAGAQFSVAAAQAMSQFVHTDTSTASTLYFTESTGGLFSDQSSISQHGSTSLGTPNSLEIANATATGDIMFTTNAGQALTVTAAGDTNAAGNLAVTGNATVGGTLTSTGNATVGGTLTSTGNATVGGGLAVTGAITQGGNTVCDNSNNCSYAASSGAASYIQNQSAAAQSASMWIDGSVNVGTTGPLGPNLVISNVGDLNTTGDLTTAATLTANSISLNGINLTGGSALVSDHDISAIGVISATGGFVAGLGATGINTTCSGGHYLINTVVTGGIVTGGTCTTTSTGSDYAERYPSTQSLSPGEVVAIDPANPENVVRTTYVNQATAIGIVSTDPGQTVGSGNTVVALSGRVPVKVSDENGAIAAGDYLTSSSTPGVAMKASSGQKTIGQAMTSESGGMVIAFVSVSNGGMVESQQTQTATQSASQGTNSFADLNVSGTASVNNLTVTGAATVASLTVTGTAEVATLKVNGHIIGNSDTRGTVTVPAGSTSAHHAFASAYAATPVVVASPVSASASYHLSSDASGFTITIDTPAAADLEFNYLVQQ